MDPSAVIAEAVQLVLADDRAGATALVVTIDPDERWDERRRTRRTLVETAAASGLPTDVIKDQAGRNVSQRVRLSVFARDHYICRYEHCGRRTIDERVFAALSRLMPDVLPYHQNWGREKAHPMCWTHLASFEHVLPWSVGGDNSEANLVTACSLCNYTKMNLSPQQLGWTLRPVPPDDEPWDGLVGSLDALVALAPDVVAAAPTSDPGPARARSRRPAARPAEARALVPADELRVGNFVQLTLSGNRTPLRYRVVERTGTSAGLVQMWRTAGRWDESSRVREIVTADYPSVTLIAADAPLAGDLESPTGS